jgi:hypothetical protein|tara:strand:+ start:2000 stop:2656 length:657 start_codon:yes stop_codon:yes gene_type:complete
MSYYTRARHPKPVTISTKAAEDMIEFLLKVKGLSEWEASFVKSLEAGWEKYGSVTEKQHSQIQKLVDRHTPEKILARAAWTEGYNETMRSYAQICAHYYKANPPYFGDLASRVLEDPAFVPSERAYNAMCRNKYALKVIALAEEVPQFPVGTMAVARASNQGPTSLRGQTVLIIEHPIGVHSAANGARRVVVLPVGGSDTCVTEERWLKKLPKKLRRP